MNPKKTFGFCVRIEKRLTLSPGVDILDTSKTPGLFVCHGEWTKIHLVFLQSGPAFVPSILEQNVGFITLIDM